jgi:hypothetical protein
MIFRCSAAGELDEASNVSLNFTPSDGSEIRQVLTYGSERSFSTSIYMPQATHHNKSSIFYQDSIRGIISDLFHIKGAVHMDFSQKEDRVVRTLTIKSASPDTINIAHRVSIVINGSTIDDLDDKSVMDIFLAFLYLKKESDGGLSSSQLGELARYAGTVICDYFLKQTIIRQGARHTYISIDIAITRKDDMNSSVKLHNYYSSLVQSGDIMPLTPIQFAFYFNKDILIK